MPNNTSNLSKEVERNYLITLSLELRMKTSLTRLKLINLRALKISLMSDMNNPNLTKQDIIKNVRYLATLCEDDRLPDPDDNLYLFLESVESIIRIDSEKLKSLAIEADTDGSRGSSVTRALHSFTKYNADEINEVTDLYSSLEASSFKQIYNYKVTADKAFLEMKFTPNSGNSSNNIKPPLKIRSFPIKAKGGFKINTSVALTLNNYKATSNDYYINNDGFIGSTPNDNFVPNLCTMINFYPIISDNFNVGGSFGLSIPISGDIKGVNFLVGPSIFFGGNNRLSITGGLAFGAVKQLTSGLKVGDKSIGSDIQGFTKNVYDLGYYIGISFSLFDIN